MGSCGREHDMAMATKVESRVGACVMQRFFCGGKLERGRFARYESGMPCATGRAPRVEDARHVEDGMATRCNTMRLFPRRVACVASLYLLPRSFAERGPGAAWRGASAGISRAVKESFVPPPPCGLDAALR